MEHNSNNVILGVKFCVFFVLCVDGRPVTGSRVEKNRNILREKNTIIYKDSVPNKGKNWLG